MPQNYRMPEVLPEDIVLWKPGPTHEYTARALVLAVGDNRLDLAVIGAGPGEQPLTVKSGVCYYRDPMLASDRLGHFLLEEGTGVWCESPSLIRRRRLDETIQNLVERVAQLEKALEDAGDPKSRGKSRAPQPAEA